MSDLDTLLNELDDAGEPSKPTRTKRPSLPNRYMRVEDFNAASSDQVVELAKWINAHATTKADKVKLPKRRDSDEDDEDSLSTEKKYLKQAAKRHPVFRLILDCRERSKLLTTYNWTLTQDGRVTGTIGHHPSTWRKSMRDYNLQNVPKRSELANEFRRMIVAPPSHVLMEADSSAIEAVLVGYFARSERLIKLAKSGVHDWFNAHVHGWHIDSNMGLDDLRLLCKEAKKKYSKESREVAKRVVHLCLTGDHEVLTPSGWKRLDQYRLEEPVAQWASGGEITFVFPTAITNEPYVGEMLQFHGRSFDQLVTPNHGMASSVDRTLKVKRVAAVDLVDLTNAALPLVGSYDRGTLCPSDVQIRLAVVLQADGTIISQTVRVKLRRSRKIERLREILTGLPYEEQERPWGTTFKFKSALLGDAACLIDCRKEFTWQAIRLAPTARKVFLNELPYWDGSIYKKNVGTTKRVTYVTKTKKNAQIVQTISHLEGFQALLRQTIVSGSAYYIISFNKRRLADVSRLKHFSIQHEGRVYCMTVPSGYFMVRRDDRISISGNTNYRGTPERMQEEYPDEFATVSVARKLQNLYLETEPGRDLQRWWINTLERANHDRYLVTPFGMRHRFFHIYGWDSKRKQHTLGDDAKRAIAFLPQSSASAIQDIILAYLYYDTEFREWLRLPIHDSGLSYVPIDKVDSAADIMLAAFTMPFPELGSLTIGAEVKASAPGGNWADYDEVVNPLGMRTLR